MRDYFARYKREFVITMVVITEFNSNKKRYTRSLFTPLSVVQMLSFGDSRPEDGRTTFGVFDVGGGLVELSSNEKSSKSSSSEK